MAEKPVCGLVLSGGGMKKHPFGCYSAIFQNPSFARVRWWGLVAIGMIWRFFKFADISATSVWEL